MPGKTLFPLTGPQPGTVGPGTVNTLAMFGPSTTQVQDSGVLQETIMGHDFVRIPTRELLLGDPAGFSFGQPILFSMLDVVPHAWTRGVEQGLIVDAAAGWNGIFEGFKQENLIQGAGGGHRVWSYVAANSMEGSGKYGECIDFWSNSGFDNLATGGATDFWSFVSDVFSGTTALDLIGGLAVRPFGSWNATLGYGLFVDTFAGCTLGTAYGLYVTDGKVFLSGFNYPTVDGAPGDVMTTDGAGNLTLQPGSGTPSGWAEVPNIGVNLVTVTQTLLRAVIGAPNLTDQFNVDSSLNVDHIDPAGTYPRRGII